MKNSKAILLLACLVMASAVGAVSVDDTARIADIARECGHIDMPQVSKHSELGALWAKAERLRKRDGWTARVERLYREFFEQALQ